LIARERVTDTHSVLVTALIMILINPFLIYNAGFILSFTSVSGIILFNNKISGIIRLPGKYLKETVSVTLSANILTLPFIIYYFKGIPLTFILSNILMGIFVPVIMLYGIIVFLFSFANMKMGYYIALPLDYILTFNIKLIISISKIPFGYINTLSLERYLIALYFAGIYIISAFKRNTLKIIITSLIFAFFIFSLFVNVEGRIFNYADVYAFCGKDGGKVLLSYKGKNIFIDLSVENKINYNSFIKEKCKNRVDLCILGSAFSINNAKNNDLEAAILYYPEIAYEREVLRSYIGNFKTAVPVNDKINIKYGDIDLTLSIGNSYNISEAVIKIKDKCIVITNDFSTDFNSNISYIITGKMIEVYSFENILNCDKEEIERIKI